MAQPFEAVYENGVFRPLAEPSMALSEGQHVRLVANPADIRSPGPRLTPAPEPEGHTDVEVRDATPNDAPAVFQLATQLHAAFVIDPACFATGYSHSLQYDQHCCLVAVLNGQTVGYASGYRHIAFYANGLVAYLDEIVVARQSRGVGIGTQLVAAFEAWARDNQCCLVSLATAGARGFYEKLDYTSTAGYYKKYLS